MALQGQTSTQVEHPDGHFSGKNSISPSKSFSTVMASVGQFRLHQVQVQQRSLSMSTLPWILSLSTVRSTVMHSSGQAGLRIGHGLDLAAPTGEGLFLHGDGRAEVAADAADRALLHVDLELGLGLEGQLPFLAVLRRTLEEGDVSLDGVPGADVFADGALHALLVVDLRDLVVLGKPLLLDNGVPLDPIDGEGEGREGAHNGADAAVRALHLVDLDGCGIVHGSPADRSDRAPLDGLLGAGLDADATTRTDVHVQDQVVRGLEESLFLDDLLAILLEFEPLGKLGEKGHLSHHSVTYTTVGLDPAAQRPFNRITSYGHASTQTPHPAQSSDFTSRVMALPSLTQ